MTAVRLLDLDELRARRVVVSRAVQCSIGRNSFSDYRSRNLSDKIAGRVIDIQRERTAVSVASIAKRQIFRQMARSLEISIRVIEPYSVSELERLGRCLLPGAEANISLPWVDVWVVNFRSAGIPDLERLLDLLVSNQETDMPKSNDGRVDRIITRGRRLGLHQRL